MTFYGGNRTVVAGRAEKAEEGVWYVRNAAKANRKPHTPVSNEINAPSLSGARGKSDGATRSTDENDSGSIFLCTQQQDWIWAGLNWVLLPVQPTCLLKVRSCGKEPEQTRAEKDERWSMNLIHSYTMSRQAVDDVCLLIQVTFMMEYLKG